MPYFLLAFYGHHYLDIPTFPKCCREFKLSFYTVDSSHLNTRSYKIYINTRWYSSRASLLFSNSRWLAEKKEHKTSFENYPDHHTPILSGITGNEFIYYWNSKTVTSIGYKLQNNYFLFKAHLSSHIMQISYKLRQKDKMMSSWNKHI